MSGTVGRSLSTRSMRRAAQLNCQQRFRYDIELGQVMLRTPGKSGFAWHATVEQKIAALAAVLRERPVAA